MYLLDGGGAFVQHGFEAVFQKFIAHGWEPVAWQLLSLAIAAAIVLDGIERGIEAAWKALMPILAIVLMGLALQGLTLPGFARGAAFLLWPDWSALAQPGVYLAALGQGFFSIGLAMGVMVTYGSYAPRDARFPAAAFAVAMGDAVFAVAAGPWSFFRRCSASD